MTLPTRYASAKIVLLGDSGVGKSGLALTLQGQSFAPTASTHGMRFSLLSCTTTLEHGVETTRETVLWDLAGQADYRVVHQLFLTDAALALVVADPTREGWWQSAQEWSRSIFRLAGAKCPQLLVLARADVGAPREEFSSIAKAAAASGFAGVHVTSAMTGAGVEGLLAAVSQAIRWDELPVTTAPRAWMEVRASLRERATQDTLLSTDALAQLAADLNRSEELDTLLALGESQGEWWRLRTSPHVLLRIGYLNSYASLVVLQARRHPEGLGCVVANDVLNGRLPVGETERLPDPEQDRLLFREAVELLVTNGLALLEGRHLVLPSMVSRSEIAAESAEGLEVEVEYSFEGSAETIYAVLATRLAYSAVFELDSLYRHSARFLDPLGRACRFTLRRVDDNHGVLAVSFDHITPVETRVLFCIFISEHLATRAVAGTLQEDRVVTCSSCRYTFESQIVRVRITRGLSDVTCPVCETRTPLVSAPHSNIDTERLRSRVKTIERRTDQRIHEALVLLRSDFESIRTALPDAKERPVPMIVHSSAPSAVPPTQYDAFVSYSRKDSKIVLAIARTIDARGLRLWLDEWCIRPGEMFQDAIESALPRSRTITVFIGPGGMSRWELVETRVAVSLFVERELAVVPCILPGANGVQLPLFLREFQRIAFCSQDDPEALDKFEWAVTGQRPGTLTRPNSN